MIQKITPCLWFDDKAGEAMKFYTSIFKNSKIVSVNYYPDNVEEEYMKGMEGKVPLGHI
jgi:predicted 3-demethylubiquinone-9 3-methyltransferase (glyoxalase superfamily)